MVSDFGDLSLIDSIRDPGKEPDLGRNFESLFIKDDLVSNHSMDKVKIENQFLKGRIVELQGYNIVLHKMIALLKRQNVMFVKAFQNDDISSQIGSLNLKDNLTDLVEEEKMLSDLIQQKQRMVHDLEPSSRDNLESKPSAEVHNELKSCINEMKTQIDSLHSDQYSLRDSNQRLESIIKHKDDELQVMQNKLNICSSMIEDQSRETPSPSSSQSRHWIVSPSEVQISNQYLGSGAWGTVSLGTFRGLTVAVKQLHRMILSPHNRDKFLREMGISAQIRHPHILQFLCCSQQDQTLLVVTEVMKMNVREAYLSNVISKHQSLKISLQCGLALQYLHGFKPHPIIHRDISSSNVLLSCNPPNHFVAKLADFGAANFLRDELSSAPGAAIYAAPEAFSSIQNTKLDVYSFGVLLIELLTHRIPDPGYRDQHLQSISNQEIREVIGSMLLRNPNDRPEISAVVGSLRILLNLPSGDLNDCM